MLFQVVILLPSHLFTKLYISKPLVRPYEGDLSIQEEYEMVTANIIPSTGTCPNCPLANLHQRGYGIISTSTKLFRYRCYCY